MLSKFFNDCITRKNFYFLLVLILLLWFFTKNVDVAFMFFAAWLFSCSLSPLVEKLTKKMSRSMAATIVLIGLILVVCICVIPILLLGAYQITSFAQAFPAYVNNLDDMFLNSTFLNKFNIIHFDTNAILTSVAESSSKIIGNVLEFVEGLGSAFLYIFTTLVFIFFFLTDKKYIKENILKVFPSEIRKQTDDLIENISNKLSGYVLAQTLVSGSVWITMTLGLLIFNINYAIILGIVAGVMSIIPVLGSAISLVICLIATYESGLVPMIIVAVLFTISHFIENHVVRPYVYSKMLKLHPVIIFLSLFIGAKYAGVMGVILAPPIAMALCILFEELYVKKMD